MTAVRAPQREIGYAAEAGPSSYNWWMYDGETTPELRWPQSMQVYDEMRTQDAQIKSVLAAVTFPVRRTPWRIDPNGARDEVVQFVADDLGLPVVGEPKPKLPLRMKDRFSWADHVRLALLMLPFGFMMFEQVYRVTEDGSRAHLRKLGERLPRTVQEIEVARDGGLVSITQYGSSLDGGYGRQQSIPVNRLVAYVLDKEGGNWLGRSILRSAYKNWLLKDRLLRVQAQTIERNGMGIPTYTAAESETDLSKGKALATGLRAGETAGAAIPFGAQLALLGVTGTLPDADPAIRYHDEQIARAVLAHFLNLGTQTGSWALGTTFADFFTLSLQTLADQIADTATQHVVEDLVDINWGPEEPAPRIVHDEIGSRQQATAQAIKTLIDAGVIEPDEVLEESSRQQYGLPPKDPDTVRGQDQQQQDQQQQDQFALSPVFASGADGDPKGGDAGDEDVVEALLTAITLVSGQILAAEWNPLLHPRGEHGKFRTVLERVMNALGHWAKGDGPEDPLPESLFTREHLRKTAIARGLTVRRGATREELHDQLLQHVREVVHTNREAKLDAGPRQAKFTGQGAKLRDKDVAVYRHRGDKPALYFEDEHGKRGGLVEKFDDLPALEKWAEDNGEPRLAEWARKERGGVKALPSGADIEVADSLKALSNLQIVQGDHLTPSGRQALDALGPEGHPRLAAIPDTEQKVREAYRMLALPGGGQDHYVALADVRKLIGDQATRADVDATLRRMYDMPDVTLSPQHYGRSNAATRIPAAVKIGGQDNDQLHIDDPSLSRPSQFGAVAMAEELVNRGSGGDRHPLMVNLSDAELRAEVDRRIANDPTVARDIKAEVPGYGSTAKTRKAAPNPTPDTPDLDSLRTLGDADLNAMAAKLGGREAFADGDRNYFDDAQRELAAGRSPGEVADSLNEWERAVATAGPYDSEGHLPAEREDLARRLNAFALKLRVADPKTREREAAQTTARRRFDEIQKAAGTSFYWGTTRGESASTDAKNRWLRGESSDEIARDLRRQATELDRLGQEGRLTDDRTDMTGVLQHDQRARDRAAINDATGLGRLADAIADAGPLTPAKRGARKPTPDGPDLDSLRSLGDSEAIRDALDLHKVDELKALLGSAGLAKSGRKRELVDRLTDHLGGGSSEPGTPPLRQSVLGDGPMDEYEEALHALSAADVKKVAEQLNISKPPGGPWPASKEARIRYTLTSIDDARRRNGYRSFGRDAIPRMIEQLGVKPQSERRIADPADMARQLREVRSEHDAVRLLSGDASLTAAKLRLVAEELGIEIPPDVRAKTSLQLHIAEKVARERDLPFDAPDLETAARDRQVKLDQVRSVADVLTEVDELSANGASSAALRNRITGRAGVAGTPDDVRDRLLAAVEASREVEVENRIRAAYRDALSRPVKGDVRWVGLAELRDNLGEGTNRNEVDAALLRMLGDDKGTRLIPEENQKTITQAGRDSAIVVSGEPKHLISIDDPSPQPDPLRNALAKVAVEHGLTRVGDAGQTVTFDRNAHQSIGWDIPDGARVTVVRPGYTAVVDGEQVTVSKPVVQVAGPGDRPQSMSDIAHELEGLTIRQKRAKLRAWGFSAAEIDNLAPLAKRR